jgi:hypothetical protein
MAAALPRFHLSHQLLGFIAILLGVLYYSKPANLTPTSIDSSLFRQLATLIYQGTAINNKETKWLPRTFYSLKLPECRPRGCLMSKNPYSWA